jgi:uncharacterized metal-binding protein
MSGKRLAILIASSRFPNEPKLNPLSLPENDVNGLRKILRSEKHGYFDNAVVLKNVGRNKAIHEIHKILNDAQKDDLVLIYYSGHGKLNSQGHLYLATKDTKNHLLETTSISMEEVKRLMDTSRSKQQVIILDCCYSGAAGKVFTKGGFDDQLQVVFGGSGTFLMTASTAVQESHERPEDQYGVFTKHIIEGIRSGEADGDNDGFITMDDLYDYVYKHVCAENCGQEPKKYGVDVKGKLVIAKSGKMLKEIRQQQLLDQLANQKITLNEFNVEWGKLTGEILSASKDEPAPQLIVQKPKYQKEPITISRKKRKRTENGLQKYQLRKEPITVSDEEAEKLFKLKMDESDKKVWRPCEYIQNDFRDNGDGTITDLATGLMWQKSGSSEYMSHKDALVYIKKLNGKKLLFMGKKFAGYEDWRLPTVDELKSLFTPKPMNDELYINPLFDKTQKWCWTSDNRSSGGAWSVDFLNAHICWYIHSGSFYVRAVRSI